MNTLVSKLSTVVLEKSGMKMFRPDKDSRKEELFFRDIQSYYRVAKSLVLKVDEVEIGDRKLILVADDERHTCELVEEFLSQAEINCDMISAVTGDKAYDLANSLIPDLIITDWLMPEMSGPELIKKLRENNQTKHIPVILVTGLLPSTDELDEVLEVGTTDYLRKPLDYAELKARVKTALALGESNREARRLGESVGLKNLVIRFMLDSMLDATFCVDGRGYFGGCNEGFEKFARRSAAELDGRLAVKCLPAALANLVSSLLADETGEGTFEFGIPERHDGLYFVTFRMLTSGSERLIIGQVTGE